VCVCLCVCVSLCVCVCMITVCVCVQRTFSEIDTNGDGTISIDEFKVSE